MKHRLQGLVMGLIIGVLLSATIAHASGAAASIEVYFKPLQFIFNGVEKKPEQESFIYNGSTYVPIRFISESLGVPVRYDGDKEQITIGTRYAAAPPMTIDKSKTYKAAVETSKGRFTIELYAKDAPKTVNSFVFLANDGFYNNVPFHRIIESFMVQTGDPTGTGTGTPGYRFEDELNNGHSYEPGIVAMANAGPNTNGSQFFICTGEESKLLNQYANYSIFGKVVDGMDVVKSIAATPVGPNGYGELSKPQEEVSILGIEITVE